MIQYPGISYLTGYNQNPDLVGRFGQGFDLGRGIRAEQDAPGVFAAYLDSLGSGTGTAGGNELSLMGLAPTDEAMRNQQTVMGSHQAALGATDPVLDAYFRNTRQAESGGNDAARNPNSTATGRYQFLESTWNDLARRHPDLGLTPDGRTDPAQQERAMRAFTAENARTLSGAGVPVNPGTLYAAHFLGPQGAANVLRQPDNASMMAVVGPEVVKANPFLADMSVGDFKQWAAGKGGASNGGYQPPLADGGAPGTSAQMMGMQTAQAGQLPDRETMRAMFANPVTRPLAIEYAKSMIAQRTGQGSATFSQTPVFLTDPQGNTHAAQMSSSGGVLVNGQLLPGVPPGWKVSARPDNLRTIDTGGEVVVFDPNAGTFAGGPVKQGSPSTDMNVTVDEGGTRTMAPAPGSKEALERDEAARQDEQRRALRATYADIVTEDIDRLISAVTDNPGFTTGLGAALSQNMPGTPAYNAKALGDTIRANVGFDRLQQMREASPTGGALGAVSNFENELLQATLGNLELSQSQEQLLRNLERVRDIYLRIVHEGIRPGDPIAQEVLGGSGNQGDGIDALLEKYS